MIVLERLIKEDKKLIEKRIMKEIAFTNCKERLPSFLNIGLRKVLKPGG